MERQSSRPERLAQRFLGLVSTVLVLAACGSNTSTPTTSTKLEDTLVVATAGGKIQDALARHFYDAFTKKTGVKVVPVTIGYTEQFAKLKADALANKVEWDIVNVGPDSLVSQRNLFRDLGADCATVPNIPKNGAPGVCQRYGILYILGGLVLGYDTNKFGSAPPKTWADFWDVQKFPGPRALPSDEPLYMTEIALVADGVAPDKVFPMDLDRAFKKLDQIKKKVSLFWTSGDQSQQAWRQGEVVLSGFYSGRAVGLKKENQHIGIVWKGAARDSSGFAITKAAPHPNAALAFLNFFLSDEMASESLALSNDINYDPPNNAALKNVSEADKKERATYPDNWNSMISFDVDWYAKNETLLRQRWLAWLAA